MPPPPTLPQFNSTTKWQLSIHMPEDPNAKHPILVLKGAPERVLRMCENMMIDGEDVPLDADMQNKYNECEWRWRVAWAGGSSALGGACQLMPQRRRGPALPLAALTARPRSSRSPVV